MAELNSARPVSYFNLHAEGCGYLNRVRTVTPEKGSPYLACTIRGEAWRYRQSDDDQVRWSAAHGRKRSCSNSKPP